MTETVRLGLTLWPAGSTQPDLGYNDSIRLLDILTAGGALSRTTAAQPVTPAEGDVYILPATPTGAAWAAWAQHDIVYFLGGVWNRIVPVGRPLIWVAADSQLVVWTGAAWVAIAAALP